ncbi:PepSY domain-containing protein [Flavobacterium sp. RHBU_24]|uniref:PepSY domain-containing protein n=1 Tax=Flavobacterium sp. RHBU_24 TaxID=3391185 RepID=UPI0039852484
MTLSLWRYAHLTLALCSCLFLALASLTGVVLAIDAAGEKLTPYRVENFESITLAESLPTLRKAYPEISEISVNHNGVVTLQALDADFNEINAYVDPRTGKILGTPEKKSEFIQWVTSLHRSLFLHEAGRIFVGVNAFLLLLITISGTALILQRQRGLKRFFSKITKDSFNQYWHVILGRILLFPIFTLAITGTYLSMERFHLFGEEKPIEHNIKIPDGDAPQQQDLATTPLFKNTYLVDVQKIQFPFTDDPEEYYTIKLNDREIAASQFTGAILSQVHYSQTSTLAALSLSIHSGRIGIFWAVILATASLNILFFIYSGFAMTLRRRATKIKNRYKADESRFILLAGSENGSTLRFADAIHRQLLASGHKSYLAQPNDYKVYPQAEHIVLFTSTHGLGDAPSNATKLLSLIQKFPQQQAVKVSVVGFGSDAYPDFCGFAKKANNSFTTQQWAESILPVYTVNDKSAVEFTHWVNAWAAKTGIPLATTPALYNQKPKDLEKIKVLAKQTDSEHTFMLTLKASGRFTSGDLLAIYPANDNRERLYSIGKINGNIQLVVRLHGHGLGSSYLHSLNVGDTFKARIVDNKTFHLPKGKPVIMVGNGTGIAPFLGMLAQAGRKYDYQLYCGFRKETSLTKQHLDFAKAQMRNHHLKGFHMAFSREVNNMYVMDLIQRDAPFFAAHLEKGGAVMLCGSVAMQQDVEATLNTIVTGINRKTLEYYKQKGQLLTDCY